MSTQTNLREQLKTIQKEMDRLADIWERALLNSKDYEYVKVTGDDAIQASLILGV